MRFVNPGMRFMAAWLMLSCCGCARWLYGTLQAMDRTTTQPADGREHRIAVLRLSSPFDLHVEQLRVSGAPAGRLRLEQSTDGGVAVILQTPVQLGTLHLTANAGGRSLPLAVDLLPDTGTSGDGLPDWMPLHSTSDRQAFRRWSTELAERLADLPKAKLPPEVMDCASLLRYCYHEALRRHDDRWYTQFPPESMPPLASVTQWSFPDTPLGTNLFRVRPGTFHADDLHSGTFAQFADAKTLFSFNAHRLGRDVKLGRPGDLIFYRVLEENSQYHSMIITGEHGEWVVYHTGPVQGQRGEIRRVLLTDLLHHPDPRWRPEAVNPNFLGIYRWNILRGD